MLTTTAPLDSEDKYIDYCHNGTRYMGSLPELTDEKIKAFIQDELQVNTDYISLKQNYAENGNASFGSLKLKHPIGIVLLTPELIKEVEKEFTNKHKFIIAHEVGHLVNSDNYHGAIEAKRLANKIASWVGLGALFTTSAVFIITSHSITNSLVMGSLCYLIAAQVARYYCTQKESRAREFKADEFAVEKSKNIASGGIETFEQDQESNKSKWSELMNKNDNPSLGRKVYRGVMKGIINVLFTEETEVRFFGSHPSNAERVSNIKQFASSNKSLIHAL